MRKEERERVGDKVLKSDRVAEALPVGLKEPEGVRVCALECAVRRASRRQR